ncbi:MAG: Rieske (2Fe-2S) protein [Methanoregula sp.]
MPVKLAEVKDLPAGDTKVVKAGNKEILLVNTGSGIYALDNSCIHGGCRIGHGKFEGETLRCLCHGSVFNVRTGEVLDGPATQPQPTIPVTIKNGEIFTGP